MATNNRLRILLEDSDQTDYAQPREHEIEITGTPTDSLTHHHLTVGTSAETLDIANFTEPATLLVHNTDATNFVTLVFTNKTAAASVSMKLLAGEAILVPDVDTDTNPTLTADTAACKCTISVFG